MVESTWRWADLLPGSSFHLFTSESRHHEKSLHLKHGNNAHTGGYCKDYKRTVCQASSTLGRTMIIYNASSTLHPQHHSAFTHLTPFTHPAPATGASLLKVSHTPRWPQPWWLRTHHCPSLICLLPRPPHGSFFSCFQSPQGHFLADFLTTPPKSNPHPVLPVLHHTALLYFPHSPACYLKCQC